LPDELPPHDSPPESPVSPTGDGEQPEPLNIEDELKNSYLSYAMSVIISRALPDVRDGLKPSQRRILVAMNDLNLGPTAATSKCAGIVGETMKRYHPHGEATIYPTLVRMAQDWNMRYRLVHSQGNFGSIAGLPPAAMRYTEARLSRIAGEMLEDLERNTVDFIDNYDGKYREPLVLPCKFPNLLVNGSDGIAVGMATEIPPHNLGEVCDGLVALIDNPDITIDQLIEIIPGPDFPTGGVICGRQGILDGYRSGRGKVTLRARAIITEEDNRSQIVINEVPYQQTRERVLAAIGELIKDERIKGVSEVKDESSARKGEPVRLVLYLKRDGEPELILNQLYQFSPLQKTVSLIMIALVDARPRTLNLKQMLEEFLRHRVEVIRRRTEFLLSEAKKRAHVLEGQLIAISSLDEVIRICRASPSRAEAKTRLQTLEVAASVLERALGADHFAALQREIGVHATYRMTEAQAEAVVRMQLGQLAALERDEILKEYNQLRGQIVGYEQLLGSEQNLRAVIRAELVELRDRYGDERRTQIIDTPVSQLSYDDLIAEEVQAITLSHNGYIKRLPLKTYRTQHRGGKGVSGGSTHEDDFIEHFFVSSTHAYLLCFTNRGQVYWLKVYSIPEMGRTSAGRAIANVLSLKPEEKITSVIPVRRFDANRHLLMATKNGLIKKTALEEYSRPKSGGIIGIALEEGDTLIEVVLTKPGDEIVLSTRMGMAIRFAEEQARAMGRNTRGVKGINLQEGDDVIGMVVADPEGFLLTVCEKGYGKRTPFGANVAGDVVESESEDEAVEEPSAESPIDEPAAEEEAPKDRSGMRYRKQRRGGKGLRDIRTTERNGPVIGIISARDGDDIMLITAQGMVNRTHVHEIRIVGRNTQGVRIMNLNEGDLIASIAKVAREDVEAEADAGEEAPAPTTNEPPPSTDPPDEAAESGNAPSV
jgi:DNA gyrase subunit A